MHLVTWCAVAHSIQVGIDLQDLLHISDNLPGLPDGGVVGVGIGLLPVTEDAIRGKAKQMGMAEKAEIFRW